MYKLCVCVWRQIARTRAATDEVALIGLLVSFALVDATRHNERVLNRFAGIDGILELPLREDAFRRSESTPRCGSGRVTDSAAFVVLG